MMVKFNMNHTVQTVCVFPGVVTETAVLVWTCEEPCELVSSGLVVWSGQEDKPHDAVDRFWSVLCG